MLHLDGSNKGPGLDGQFEKLEHLLECCTRLVRTVSSLVLELAALTVLILALLRWLQMSH